MYIMCTLYDGNYVYSVHYVYDIMYTEAHLSSLYMFCLVGANEGTWGSSNVTVAEASYSIQACTGTRVWRCGGAVVSVNFQEATSEKALS